MKPENRPKIEFEGKEYDDYQATQMQRKIERTIRRKKREVAACEAAGLTDEAAAAKSYLRRLNQEYRDFSRAAGLPEQRERMKVLYTDDVSAKKTAKALEKSSDSGIIDTNRSREIPEVSRTATPRRTLTPEDVTKEYLETATPGQGTVTYDTGYVIERHNAEVTFSKWLHDTFGGDIKLLNEVNENKVNTPDYIWRGKLWDLKTTSTEKAANAALRHGLVQIRENPGGIFLDYRGLEINLDVLSDVIHKRLQWRNDTTPIDIMIVLDSGTYVWRY